VKLGRWLAVTAAVLVCWMGGYAVTHRAPDETAYRTICVSAAQQALDGLATAGTVAGPDEATFIDTYVTASLDDAGRLLREAGSALPGIAPPDRHSAALRDELTSLLARANAAYGDAVRARATGDVTGQRAAVARFAPIEQRLRDFIERNRSS
jgi:hypothetical protein